MMNPDNFTISFRKPLSARNGKSVRTQAFTGSTFSNTLNQYIL